MNVGLIQIDSVQLSWKEAWYVILEPNQLMPIRVWMRWVCLRRSLSDTPQKSRAHTKSNRRKKAWTTSFGCKVNWRVRAVCPIDSTKSWKFAVWWWTQNGRPKSKWSLRLERPVCTCEFATALATLGRYRGSWCAWGGCVAWCRKKSPQNASDFITAGCSLHLPTFILFILFYIMFILLIFISCLVFYKDSSSEILLGWLGSK